MGMQAVPQKPPGPRLRRSPGRPPARKRPAAAQHRAAHGRRPDRGRSIRYRHGTSPRSQTTPPAGTDRPSRPGTPHLDAQMPRTGKRARAPSRSAPRHITTDLRLVGAGSDEIGEAIQNGGDGRGVPVSTGHEYRARPVIGWLSPAWSPGACLCPGRAFVMLDAGAPGCCQAARLRPGLARPRAAVRLLSLPLLPGRLAAGPGGDRRPLGERSEPGDERGRSERRFPVTNAPAPRAAADGRRTPAHWPPTPRRWPSWGSASPWTALPAGSPPTSCATTPAPNNTDRWRTNQRSPTKRPPRNPGRSIGTASTW